MVRAWRDGEQHWGLVTRSVHWLSVLTVVGLYLLGDWMVELTYYDDWYRSAPALHKSIGLTLFAATVLRFIWRLTNTTPTPLANHTRWEKQAAKVAHRLLYLLLITVMISGYLISTADGRPVAYFELFEIPATLTAIEQQEEIFGDIHFVLASTLIGLALVHALGALKHHFVDKDRTLLRMFGINNRREI